MWFLLIVFAALLIRASIEWMRGEPERYPHEYVRQFTLLLGEIALCAGVLARERSWLRRLLISVTFALLLVNSYFTYFAR